MLQPMRSSAASAFGAFTDGHFWGGYLGLGGNEGNVHGPGHSFAVFQTVGNQAQRQRLDRCGGLFLGAAIYCDARERRDVGQPPPAFLPVILDGERETFARRSFPHDSIMPQNGPFLSRVLGLPGDFSRSRIFEKHLLSIFSSLTLQKSVNAIGRE